MTECIFCKIIAGEIPCEKIFENQHTIAFLDINPITRGHILVIPKKHFVNILDIEEIYLIEVLKSVKKISNHLISKKLATGINILNASGKTAEQSVFHLHFHILPRYSEDRFKIFPNTGYVKEDLNKIKELFKIE